ncbi:MAG TPA: L-aspartate oxidase [Pirellulales bacterium]|nr:L-aspartate oxidase [Pirellulales bacterium]
MPHPTQVSRAGQDDPRYLVPFHPKRVPHHFTDVLIIGGGLAGLRAALAVDSRLRVLVVSKDNLTQSNSHYAQGGIAGVLDPEDRFENHVADTLRAGGDLCDPEVVEMVVREAPARIHELMEWGAHFDEEAGSLALGREGGHSHDRIVHALGDATGKEVMRAVIARTGGLPNVETWQDTFTLDLLTRDGLCRGALVWNPRHGKTLVWAKQTILCTGGAGRIYRETTNPPVATADGHAIALRAGAELRDMEFMQFHPTVLYIAGSSRSLITEAMRGAGARLVDRDGHRFMPDYDPRAELAPRDVVSQAIVAQMAKTRHPSVYLDLSHLPAERVRSRFPGIAAICGEFGIDIAGDWIPVRPGAHYMVGGVTVDGEGRTTLAGLWAAGEVSSSGLHGANRLASNSLLEGLVYGAHAGEGVSRLALGMTDDYRALPLENPAAAEPVEPLDLDDIRNSLRSLMWRHAGVRRDAAGLAEADDAIGGWCGYVLNRQFADPAGWQLQNMLWVARTMIAAAQAREESRGVHLRMDFPTPDNEHWQKHLAFRRS